MNTIKNIIKHNRILEKNPFNNKNLNILKEDIDKLIDDYDQNNKKIIENIILNILNKKDINDDEINMLTNIIYKLSNEEMNVLKLSTLFIIIDKIFFIKRENIDDLVDLLNEIDNKDIKNYLRIIEGKYDISSNLKELKLGDLFESFDGIIIELFGFYKNEYGKKSALLYGKDGEKSIIEDIPLDKLIEYNKIYNNNNNTREKFSLIKAISGKEGKEKIERNRNRYLIKLPPEINIPNQNRIIYTKLNGDKLTDPLKPSENNSRKI